MSSPARAACKRLEADGWLAVSDPAGVELVDVIALRAGESPRLLKVFGSARIPFETFGLAERARLSSLATRCGAECFLAYWPAPGRLELIAEHQWPIQAVAS